MSLSKSVWILIWEFEYISEMSLIANGSPNLCKTEECKVWDKSRTSLEASSTIFCAFRSSSGTLALYWFMEACMCMDPEDKRALTLSCNATATSFLCASLPSKVASKILICDSAFNCFIFFLFKLNP